MKPFDEDWPRCACGCGEAVPARKANCTARGYIKGEPCKFVAGHSARLHIKLPKDGTLHCPRCDLTKAVDEFNKCSTRPSGYDSWCRGCQRDAYLARRPPMKYRRWETARARERANASAYRARKRGAFVEHVDPFVVFERDEGTCGICHLPIVGPFAVDHITPLVRGGEHSYANSQAAHPSCNSSKKDRLDFTFSGSTSASPSPP